MIRGKMTPAERAKQFMPFAALKGFDEVLKEKEKIIVPRMELSEEYKEELDWKMRQIQKNDMITVVYFHNGEYIRMTGMVSKLDVAGRALTIVNTRILFDDIYDMSFV